VHNLHKITANFALTKQQTGEPMANTPINVESPNPYKHIRRFDAAFL